MSVNRINTIAANIVAAIKSMSPLSAEFTGQTFDDDTVAVWERIRMGRIPVIELVAPRDLWAVPTVPAIGVTIPDDQAVDGQTSAAEIGWYGNQPRLLRIMIGVIANVTIKNIDSARELHRISDAVSQFRQFNIGPPDQGGVYSYRSPGSSSFELVPHPTRADPETAGAGPVIRIDTYITTVIDI